jgi:hypothetical protein
MLQEISQFREATSRKPTSEPSFAIQYSNHRTVPCKNYHGSNGCIRGESCHFFHAIGYERVNPPREVFQQYRNENLRKNMLEAIQKVNPQAADELLKSNAPNQAIQNYIYAYNQKMNQGHLLPS